MWNEGYEVMVISERFSLSYTEVNNLRKALGLKPREHR